MRQVPGTQAAMIDMYARMQYAYIEREMFKYLREAQLAVLAS